MNADAWPTNKSGMQRPIPEQMQIHKTNEPMAAVPLGRRFNWGHQNTPGGASLYPVPPHSVFHRSLTQLPCMGNLWVDASNTYEDARLEKQPYHLERDTRTMTAYSYDRRVAPGSYVEPVLFNLSTHPNWKTRAMDRFQQSKIRRDKKSYSVPRRGNEGAEGQYSCMFVGFADYTMEKGAMTRGELDRLMVSACHSKFPCSRPATYEEYISKSIGQLPKINRTKFDVTFIGPGSEKLGPGALDHKNTLFCRKKVVFPGERLDGSSGQIEISDSSCWGRKTCIAVVYVNRIIRQPSLKQFGLLRNCIDQSWRGDRQYMESLSDDETQWNTFPHLYHQTIVNKPLNY